MKSFHPSLLNPTFDFNILWEVEGAYGKSQWRETAGSGVSIKTRFHFTGENPETSNGANGAHSAEAEDSRSEGEKGERSKKKPSDKGMLRCAN